MKYTNALILLMICILILYIIPPVGVIITVGIIITFFITAIIKRMNREENEAKEYTIEGNYLGVWKFVEKSQPHEVSIVRHHRHINNDGKHIITEYDTFYTANWNRSKTHRLIAHFKNYNIIIFGIDEPTKSMHVIDNSRKVLM